MKLFSKIQSRQSRGHAANSAYSITEMLIAVGIFSLIVVGMVTSQMFALRTYSISKSKMIASSSARKSEDWLRDSIRGANAVYIGNFTSFSNMNLTGSAFPAITNGAQQGNSIEIFPTTNTTSYWICWVDTGTDKLKLYNSSNTNTLVLANYVINTNVFASEDFQGNVLSGNTGNSTIRMKLQMYQSVYWSGGGNVNDYYNYTMRATIR